MANRKKEVYKPKPMTEGKRNLIQGLLQEYDIQSAEDIQDALKDLFSGTIQDMLETEMDDHLGYDCYERSGEPNYRNGMKSKTVRSKYGEFQVDVPQDRQSSFEPQILPKRQKDISSIDDKIISMYAKGMTTRQISETIEDIYGFEVSEGMVSDITDKLLPRIEEQQNRPLSPVYPIVFIDAVHFSVRDDGVIRKLAAYVVLAKLYQTVKKDIGDIRQEKIDMCDIHAVGKMAGKLSAERDTFMKEKEEYLESIQSKLRKLLFEEIALEDARKMYN